MKKPFCFNRSCLALLLIALLGNLTSPPPVHAVPPKRTAAKPAQPAKPVTVVVKAEKVSLSDFLSRIEACETRIIAERNALESRFGARNLQKTIYDFMVSRSISTEVLPRIQPDIQKLGEVWKKSDTQFFQPPLQTLQDSRAYAQRQGSVTREEAAYLEDGITIWGVRAGNVRGMFDSRMKVLEDIADRERDNQRLEETISDTYMAPDPYYRKEFQRQIEENKVKLDVLRQAFQILADADEKNNRKPVFSALGASSPIPLAAADVNWARFHQRQARAQAMRQEAQKLSQQERDALTPLLQSKQAEYDQIKKQLAFLEQQLQQRFQGPVPDAAKPQKAPKPDTPAVTALKEKIRQAEDAILSGRKTTPPAETLSRFKALETLKAQLEKETAKKPPRSPEAAPPPKSAQALESEIATVIEKKYAVQRELDTLHQKLQNATARLRPES